MKTVRLLEVEVKELLDQYNLPLPKRYPEDELNNPSIYPIVLKSQVPIGGRGKLGGIKFATTPEEAKKLIKELLSLEIKGYLPEKIVFEEKISIIKEYYCGFIVNRNDKTINFIFSEAGGVEIEGQDKDKISITPIIPFGKDYNDISSELVKNLNLNQIIKDQLLKFLPELIEFVIKYDAELFEINPLIETEDHELIIADSRMNIDDNSLFRHSEFKKNLEYYLNPIELEARELGMAYVSLDGNIGIICNGAGLVMGTLDTVQSYGGKPANFLDVGGGANEEQMYQALKLISTNENVQAILINIIGGITRCDEIAKGLIRFLNENEKIKYSLRLMGTNEEEARELLKPYKTKIYNTLEEAIKSLSLFFTLS